MSRFPLLLLLLVSACESTLGGEDPDTDQDSVGLLDQDGDGFAPTDGDCDDGDAALHPGAEELCDGVDNDCDGAIDDATVAQWFADADGDAYGNPDAPSFACVAPAGHVANDADCDDTSADALPGGTEVCDALDNDCDGAFDEGVTLTFWADDDGDGAGDVTRPVEACERGGYAATSDDCDDQDPAAYPGLAEICDGIDNDCDGAIDQGVTTTWYRDTDGDGWGDLAVSVDACAPPDDYTESSGDTDDTNPDVSPGATELCNGIDDDCDGVIDEDDAADAASWYADADADGFGDPGAPRQACVQPADHVADASDCDDLDPFVSPDEIELCDSLDNDCDGVTDEGCPVIVKHCGAITVDETWSGTDIHDVTCDVTVGSGSAPTLTIEDGAVVEFAAGTGISVAASSAGRLVVDGASTGVTFTRSSTAVSAWDGLSFGAYDRDSILDGATIEHAGANTFGNVYVYAASSSSARVTITRSTISDSTESGVWGASGARLDISDSLITDNADWGVYLDADSELDGTFSGNVLTDNDRALALHPAYVGQLDATTTIAGNLSDDDVHVWPGTLALSATWSDLGVPYLLTGDVYVEGSAGPTLTLDDGVVVEFDPGYGLYVGASDDGKLVVDGTTDGVTLTSSASVASAGDWKGLSFGSRDLGSELYGADVLYGGSNGYGGVYLVSSGSGGATVTLEACLVSFSSTSGLYVSGGGRVGVTLSEVSDNGGYGIDLGTSGILASFTGNVVTGNGDFPIYLSPLVASMLDGSSSFIGNATDAIELPSATMSSSTTWQALDVPYRLTGDLNIRDSSAPTFTIEAGAMFEFTSSAGLYIGASDYGALYAVGTAADPITFTGVGGASWEGIELGSYTRPSTMDHLDVSYGGTNGYGNIWFSNVPATTTLSSSTTSYSARYGIYRQSSTPTLTAITYVSNTSGTLY